MKKMNRRKLTEQVRELVDRCGLSRYRIAKTIGMDHASMSRFMSGERGLSMEMLDALADLLDLEVVMHGPNADQLQGGSE